MDVCMYVYVHMYTRMSMYMYMYVRTFPHATSQQGNSRDLLGCKTASDTHPHRSCEHTRRARLHTGIDVRLCVRLYVRLYAWGPVWVYKARSASAPASHVPWTNVRTKRPGARDQDHENETSQHSSLVLHARAYTSSISAERAECGVQACRLGVAGCSRGRCIILGELRTALQAWGRLRERRDGIWDGMGWGNNCTYIHTYIQTYTCNSQGRFVIYLLTCLLACLRACVRA